MSKSREKLNTILRQIDIQGKYCLDIGVQDKPTHRLTQGNPANYATMDIDDQWNPDIVGDLNEPWKKWVQPWQDNKELKYKNNFYDVIFCLEVLEHCWNPVTAVRNIAELTKPGGMVYISTPFINPHHDYWDYLRYTDEWYEEVLPKVGLTVVSIEEREATVGLPALQQFYKEEGLKYSKVRMQKHGPYTYPIGYFVTARRQR